MRIALGVALLLSAGPPARLSAQTPKFEDVLSLQSVGGAVISPDGKHIAYTVRSTEWKDNRYDNEIWLSRDGGKPVQITRTAKNSSGTPRWSPDSKWIGFVADRGAKNQVYLISAMGGEAIQLTRAKDGVNNYRWSPDGKKIAYTSNEPESQAMKDRKEKYGEFTVEDGDFVQTQLWVTPVDLERITAGDSLVATKLTDNADATVGSFVWSPDGARIAFDHTRDPLITSGSSSDISLVDVNTKTVTPLVRAPGSDQGPVWSPDGQSLLYSSNAGDTTSNFYRNNQVFRIAASGGAPTRVGAGFDEQIFGISWTAAGAYFTGFNKTRRFIYRLDPASGAVTKAADSPLDIFGLDLTPDGKTAAITAQTSSTLTEVYRVAMPANGGSLAPEKITDFTAQIASWPIGKSEVVSWKSTDGATIEGVLNLPKDFDPAKKYPLFVVIHGGPTGIDMPQPVPFYVYPIPEWTAEGAIVLRPNYRGSAGYGEAFRALNVKNLGVGDMWDVMSGVDALIKRGIVDTTRMGAMGWSQGGYISAFLTTNTNRFKAISVGAGISNWVTYYVATDIHPFTRQYLKATPWDDPGIYAKTSGMTNIKNAKTPTLIQHGEFDRRVPIQNAYELFQGLQDVGVPTKLVVYKGFGHGINKPKEQLAATQHNWEWMARYVLGKTPSAGGQADGRAGGQVQP
jgi:dipeptidyl aminopeptidase/acylaminoacyl peptidase